MLARNLLAAHPAVRLARASKEHAEIIVYLRGRRNGRARIPTGATLLNGNRRRQSGNIRYCRLLHLFEELPGVCTERLDVFPAALGINRIERKGTLARAAYARNNDHNITRNAQVDILEIVLSGARYLNRLLRSFRHSLSFLASPMLHSKKRQ